MARTWTLADTLTWPTNYTYWGRGWLAVNPTKTTVYLLASDDTKSALNRGHKVFSWNGSTLQDISGSVFTASNFHIHDICMFNGVLYVLHTFDSSSEGRISRWNGGQSWSTIWDLEDESATKGVLHSNDQDVRYIDSNNGRLVVVAGFPGAGNKRHAASSDGTTFTMQTIDSSTTVSPDHRIFGASKYFAYTSSVVNQGDSTDTGNPIADTDGDDDWVKLSASDIGAQTLIGYGDNKSFWNTGQYSTDWGVNISGSASQILSVWAITSSIVMGRPNTPVYRARTWNTGTNAWDDDGDISTSDESIRSYFLINGTLYLLSTGSGGKYGNAYVYTAGSVVSYGYTHSADAIPGVIKV